MTSDNICGIKVYEQRNMRGYNDITVLSAELTNPVIAKYGTQKVETYTCVMNDYMLGEERNFIRDLIEKFPGKYKSFRIDWSDSN